jgi:hypothetical protein
VKTETVVKCTKKNECKNTIITTGNPALLTSAFYRNVIPQQTPEIKWGLIKRAEEMLQAIHNHPLEICITSLHVKGSEKYCSKEYLM